MLAVEGAKYNIKANAIAPIAKTRMTEDLLGALGRQARAAEFITPVVAWLVHEDCPVTGEVYSVGGGLVARIFIGLTDGYLRAEPHRRDVRDHFDKIRDEANYTVPSQASDELQKLLALFSD